jgi:hypothetical protein
VQKGGISKSANVRSNRNECFSNNNKFTTRLKAPPWRNFFYGGGGALLTKEIRKWVVIMKVRMMFWFRGPVACFVHAMLNLEWWHAGRSLCGS